MLTRNGKKTVSALEKKLNKAQAAYDKRTDALQDDYRTRVVVPLCAKKKWEFIAGMGDFGFYKFDGEPVSDSLVPKRVLSDLKQSLINPNHSFGASMCDVTQSDIAAFERKNHGNRR